MRVTEVAKKLSSELGIHVTADRIYRLEERGILPQPKKKKGRKDYDEDGIERIKKVVVASELGIHLGILRRYLADIDRHTQIEKIKKRQYEVDRLLSEARRIRW